jgi:hypothetical protein
MTQRGTQIPRPLRRVAEPELRGAPRVTARLGLPGGLAQQRVITRQPGEKDQLETCRSSQFRRPTGPATAHAERRTPKRAICYRGARQGRGRAATGLPTPSAQKTCRPQTSRNRNDAPPSWPSARQAGRIWAAGNGIEVKDRRRLPAELLVKFKAAAGKQPRGKAPQARPSVRPHAK